MRKLFRHAQTNVDVASIGFIAYHMRIEPRGPGAMGRRIFGAVLMGALAAVMASATAGGQAGVACCDDANGRRVCGNPLPSECYGRKYWLIDDSGVVRKVVDPAAERARRRMSDDSEDLSAQERMLRRKHERLLQAFPTLEAFDAWRDAQLAGYDRQIDQIREMPAEKADPEAVETAVRRLQEEREAAAKRLAAERRELEEALKARQPGR